MSDQTRNLKKFYLLSLLASILFVSFFLLKKDLYLFNKFKNVKEVQVEEVIEEDSETRNWFKPRASEGQEDGKADNTKIIKRIIGLL